jgi:hypothetical protein
MTHPDQRPRDPEARGTDGTRRTGRASVKGPAEDVLQLWRQARDAFSGRPDVVAADPALFERCLCGEPADSVVKTRWFNGRHSHDPVCRRHVDEVVRAIKKEQARRNGA